MLRKTKIITGSSLAAVAALSVAVPAYASSTSSAASGGNSAHRHHHAAHRDGLIVLGLTRAAIAKDAGTDIAGLKAGRRAGQSLTQIGASHHVSRLTLLSRLDATADAHVAKWINTKLPEGKARRHPAARKWARHHGIGAAYKKVASTLNLTPHALTADLKKGETLQQIATAQHVSTATLTAAIDQDVNARVAKAADRVPTAHTAHHDARRAHSASTI